MGMADVIADSARGLVRGQADGLSAPPSLQGALKAPLGGADRFFLYRVSVVRGAESGGSCP